jgi:hypothetical protein
VYTVNRNIFSRIAKCDEWAFAVLVAKALHRDDPDSLFTIVDYDSLEPGVLWSSDENRCPTSYTSMYRGPVSDSSSETAS